MMRFFISTWLILLVELSLSAQVTPLRSLYPGPNDVPGWGRLTDPQLYQGEYLYDLIDGGADLYYEYGFRQVISGQITDRRQNTVLIEIYEMEDDSAAFGIFSITHFRSGIKRMHGIELMESNDFISFRKKNYLVNIAWVSKQEKSLPEMAEISGFIRDRIEGESSVPAIALPLLNHPDISQVAYFTGNIALSNLYYFDYKDPFRSVDGVFCRYRGSIMIVFRYHSGSSAEEASAYAKQVLMNSKRFSDFGMLFQGFSFKDNKGNHLRCIQDENYLVVQVMPPDVPPNSSVLIEFLTMFH